MKEEFDFESIKNKAIEQLKAGKPLMGNRRNGKMQKQVQTPLGEVTVSTPRDRNSSFDPQFIKKRETILAEGVADRIIGLYAKGNQWLDGRKSWEPCFGRHNQSHHRPCTFGDKSMKITDA